MCAVVLVNAVGSSGKACVLQRHFLVTYQPLHCFWAVLLYILLRSRNGGIPSAYQEDDMIWVVDVGERKHPSHQLIK